MATPLLTIPLKSATSVHARPHPPFYAHIYAFAQATHVEIDLITKVLGSLPWPHKNSDHKYWVSTTNSEGWSAVVDGLFVEFSQDAEDADKIKAQIECKL